MQIGNRIRIMRQRCGLTQEELADRCELTKGYISQLESDTSSPSIATLSDILEALGTTPAEFFKEEQEEKVVFTEADYFEKESDTGTITWLVPNAQKNEMEPIIAHIPPHTSTTVDMPHEGEEFGYVMSGSVIVHIGNKSYRCKEKGTFYIVSNKPHFIENKYDKPAKVIWVASPPTF